MTADGTEEPSGTCAADVGNAFSVTASRMLRFFIQICSLFPNYFKHKHIDKFDNLTKYIILFHVII